MINHAISDKIYDHVLNVWKAFKMNAMKNYHDLHLKVDVLWLACVSETFRKESIHSFDLDSAHCLSTPGYSLDAIQKFTDVSLKLILDIGKNELFENIIRGGISMICKGYA